MVMQYAYYVGRNGQWRYDVNANTWASLPSARPLPAGTPFGSDNHQWAVIGSYMYALLEDGCLYRAQWTDTDLVWSGPLMGGYSFTGSTSPAFHIDSYQITNVADQVWIIGTNKLIAIYDPDLDAIDHYIDIPTTMANITSVGVIWDRQDKAYVALGSNVSSANAFFVYDLNTGWATLSIPSGALTGLLQPVSTLWWNDKVYSLDGDGALLYYTPATDTWAFYSEAQTLLAFGGWLARLGDTQLGMIHSGGFDNLFRRLSNDFPTGTFGTNASAPTVPNGTDIGFFAVAAVPQANPFPGTIWPTEINLPKTFGMTEVPGVRGAVAVESTYGVPHVTYQGKLSAGSDTELRDLIETALFAFTGPLMLEVLPGRFATCYVNEHTLDPKWVGVNDTLVDFSFSVRIPDALFYDYEGFGYHIP